MASIPLLSGCAVTPIGGAAGSAPAPVVSAAPGTVNCDYRPGGTPAAPADPPLGRNVPATGTSSATLTMGGKPVQIELDRTAAPCTVASFESLISQGYFTGTSCHRLATTGLFMLQCGDPSGTGRGGPGYSFDDELAGVTGYPAGTVAMANAGPGTNGSQFFLVYADSRLPPNYTVFGRMDAASTQVVADLAALGHDASYPDGTGRPHADTTISAAVSG